MPNNPPDELLGRIKSVPKQLDLLVADMNGVPRGKTVGAGFLESNELPHLAAAIFFHTITGTYAAAMTKYNAKDEDLLLDIDWDTYRPTPWKGKDHSQVICQSLDKNMQAIQFDPRNVLERVIAKYAEQGLFPIVAPEVEFYLVEPGRAGDLEMIPAPGTDQRVESTGEAFSVDALDKYSAFINDVQHMAEEMNIPLSAIVHEIGPAQIELKIGHGDPLSRADQLFLLKRLVKGCALRHGYSATFTAKPMLELPGSGMHVHTSVNDAQGDNLFALKNDLAPDALRYFIGGLQKYIPRAFALVAPNVNSFKRFVPGLSAPINLAWGYDNRTTGFRVPFGDAQNGRVENRIAGADANPYLLIAASLACGLLGLNDALDPGEPVEKDAYKMKSDLPRDIHEALRSLESDENLTELLSQPFIDIFVSVKRNELAHFATQITPWEIQYLGGIL